jgi:hypothetical protein
MGWTGAEGRRWAGRGGQSQTSALSLGERAGQGETDTVPDGLPGAALEHGRRVAAQGRAFVGDVEGDRVVQSADGHGDRAGPHCR